MASSQLRIVERERYAYEANAESQFELRAFTISATPVANRTISIGMKHAMVHITLIDIGATSATIVAFVGTRMPGGVTHFHIGNFHASDAPLTPKAAYATK